MELINLGVVLIVCYFAATGLTFLIKPAAVAMYDMAPVGPAGRTEVRCYYGALALGLGGFMAYTRTAIAVESGFVVALAVVLTLG